MWPKQTRQAAVCGLVVEQQVVEVAQGQGWQQLLSWLLLQQPQLTGKPSLVLLEAAAGCAAVLLVVAYCISPSPLG